MRSGKLPATVCGLVRSLRIQRHFDIKVVPPVQTPQGMCIEQMVQCEQEQWEVHRAEIPRTCQGGACPPHCSDLAQNIFEIEMI